MKPGLIIGGASKSGTTAIYYYLRQHPEICLSEKKELHFFSRPWLEDAKSGPGDSFVLAEIPKTIEEYLSFFSHCGNEKVAVDISPSYLFHQQSADEIKRHLGNVQVVFILRNPADKAFSQYMHLLGAGREMLGFKDALAQEADREAEGYGDMWLYRRSGFYYDAIKRFMRVFGRKNVKVFYYEEFLSDPASLLNKICELAGVDTEYEFQAVSDVNRSGLPKSLLMAKLIAPNPITYLLRRIMPRRLGQIIRNRLKEYNTGAKPYLCNDVRNMLLTGYEGDIRSVEALVGRVSGWVS